MGLAERVSGYPDLYFRIILSLLSAHIIVSFGAKESLFLLLISWYYYRSLLLSSVIAFLLVSAVYVFTVALDKRYDWRAHPLVRSGLQLLLGLILPCIMAFLLAAGYFSLFGLHILKTNYLKFDFPVIVIMLLLLNVYYLAFYFYRQWQLTERRVLEASYINDLQPAMMPSIPEIQKAKEIFMVQKGAKIIPLAVESIGYFFHEGDFNFARTFEKEDFVISQSLDEVEQQLSNKQFFRVNRQMIVNFTACQHFEPIAFGKLELFTTPSHKTAIVISKKRAKLFKGWMQR